MITHNDAVKLLALAARSDQRTVGDDDVADWLTVGRMHRWTGPLAARVIVEHYAAGADRPRITPAAITDRIRTLRGRACESFEMPRIPDDLPAREYPAWLRARRDAHVDALLDDWVTTGGELPTAAQVQRVAIQNADDLAAAAPAELREQLRADLARLTDEHRADRRAARVADPVRGGPTRDPHQRAIARAELEARRPAPVPAEEASS